MLKAAWVDLDNLLPFTRPTCCNFFFCWCFNLRKLLLCLPLVVSQLGNSCSSSLLSAPDPASLLLTWSASSARFKTWLSMALRCSGKLPACRRLYGQILARCSSPLLGTVPWFGTVLLGPCALLFSPHSGAITIFQGGFYLFFFSGIFLHFAVYTF